MSFTVSLTSSAKQDVRSTIQWIAERSRSGAESWFRKWLKTLDRLNESGDSCGLAPEDEDHEETIYQIIFKTRRGLPYRALFVIRGYQLFVLHVRGPGQDFVAVDDLQIPGL